MNSVDLEVDRKVAGSVQMPWSGPRRVTPPASAASCSWSNAQSAAVKGWLLVSVTGT